MNMTTLAISKHPKLSC